MLEKEKRFLKIGELAKKAGVTVRTVRYYEELGLLHPSDNSPGGFRLYTDDDLRRLLFVKRFKNLDFSLEEIQKLTEVKNEDLYRAERISLSLLLLQKQFDQAEKKVNEYKELKAEIENAIELLNECNCCSLPVCDPECTNKVVMI